jgi:hypothetical protein
VGKRRLPGKGSPGQRKEMAEIAFAAYTNTPPDEEAGLEAWPTTTRPR